MAKAIIVPELGNTITLSKKWSFSLINESRNARGIDVVSITKVVK
jgi:hypothetical protein